MENLVFIKLGGSLITDKSTPFTEKRDVIRRLARENNINSLAIKLKR